MDNFGCCSSYIACSDNGKCIHINDPQYIGCSYLKNLEAGRTFYGMNAGSQITSIVATTSGRKNKEYTLYLACYRRLFVILSRNKNTFSYNLDADKYEKLKCLFDDLSIPYRTDISILNGDIDGPIIEDDSPANSRAVFKVDDEEFNVLNFNSYLMQNYFAEMIVKAFKKNGIESRVEKVGSHSKALGDPVSIFKQVESKPKEVIEEFKVTEIKRIEYVQLSLF